MPNIKISQLPGGTVPLTGFELFPCVQAGSTVRVPSSALVGSLIAPGGTGTHCQRRAIEKLSASTLLGGINLRGVDYPAQVIGLLGLLEGIDQTDVEEQKDLKGWVVRALVYAPGKELLEGLPLNRIRTLIGQHHPTNYFPTIGQIGGIVSSLQAAQNLKTGYKLFDYDRQEKIMRCVDKGYILWRYNQRLEKIKDMLFERRVD